MESLGMTGGQSPVDYPWPSYPTGPKDHLHALGVISLNFNLYEMSLGVFFERHFPKPIAEHIFQKMTNEERISLIQKLADIYEADPIGKTEIEYALTHFQICAENRHNLLHSRLQMALEDVLAVEKQARGSPDKILEFHLKVGDLRRTADEMMAGFNFMIQLWWYFDKRDHFFAQKEGYRQGVMPDPPEGEAPTLPKRPPKPRKINPRPLA
jgi:hypothetical protein